MAISTGQFDWSSGRCLSPEGKNGYDLSIPSGLKPKGRGANERRGN